VTAAGRPAREREEKLKNCQVFPVLRTILISLALIGLAAADADEANKAIVAGTGTGAAGMSSQQARPEDFWFKPDALDISVYGLSYHPDRGAVHRLNLDNQVNPGLGLHYALIDDQRGITFAEVGGYQDSGRNWAKFAALGYQFKVSERWRLGGAVAALNSDTYNRGVTFFGMIPLITYDLGPVKLNAVYFPKVGHYNEVDAFGFYLSLPIGRWLQ
jgi:hypothetical protein